MAGEWRETTLGDVIELKRGYDLPRQERAFGNVPIVSSSGVTDYHATAMVKGPGVVTGRYGTLGQVFYIDEDFWPLNTALYVRDFKGNDPRFISFLLRTLDFLAYSDKAAVPGLNRNHLHQAVVRFPFDVKEQRAIAHIVGTLDDKIELNRRMNETLEAMARGLFKSWFVDFEPVRAKAEGRDIGLLAPFVNLFPTRLVDSELGDIPKGWEVQPLRDLVGYLSRGLSPAYTEAGGICVLNQKCIRDRRIDFSKARRHDVNTRSVEGRTLNALDILVNSTGVGTLGRVAQIWDLPERAIVDSHVTVIRAATSVDPWFLGVTLIERETEIEELGEGSTGQTELSRSRLGGMLYAIPPVELQRVFGRMVAPLLSRLAVNERMSGTLAALRDNLLPKLVSGDLHLTQAERF